jgi:hypothetical protein
MLKRSPLRAVEPGSRATKAMSIPAAGAFSGFARRIPDSWCIPGVRLGPAIAGPSQGRRIATVSQQSASDGAWSTEPRYDPAARIACSGTTA